MQRKNPAENELHFDTKSSFIINIHESCVRFVIILFRHKHDTPAAESANSSKINKVQ